MVSEDIYQTAFVSPSRMKYAYCRRNQFSAFSIEICDSKFNFNVAFTVPADAGQSQA